MVSKTKHAIAAGIHRLMTEILDEARFVIDFSGPFRTVMGEGETLDLEARSTLDHRDALMATTMDRFVARQARVERRLSDAEDERAHLIRGETIVQPIGPVLAELLHQRLVSRANGKLVHHADRKRRVEVADLVVAKLRRQLRKAKRKTIRASNAISHKINAIAERIGNGVQLKHVERLRKLTADASQRIEKHELELAWPLDREDPQFGAWSGTSASDIVLQIARAVADSIRSDGSVDAPWGMAEKLKTIDWGELRRTLKREMADFARSTVDVDSGTNATRIFVPSALHVADRYVPTSAATRKVGENTTAFFTLANLLVPGSTSTDWSAELVILGRFLNNAGATNALRLRTMYGSTIVTNSNDTNEPNDDPDFRGFKIVVGLATSGSTGEQHATVEFRTTGPWVSATGRGSYSSVERDGIAWADQVFEDATSQLSLHVEAQWANNSALSYFEIYAAELRYCSGST